MGLRRMLAVLLLLLASSALGEPPGVVAITGGTLHPVSGPVVQNGILVIRNGLIESVGAGIAVPPDARVVDAAGMHVYPGLIDARTGFGLEGVKGEPGADALASRSLKPAAEDERARRASGVTTVLAAPAAGIFNGQSVLLNLGEGPLETRIVKSPAAQHVSFNPRPLWTWPDSLMGVIAYVRQELLDAQQQKAARDVYQRSPAGLRRPADRPALDALLPALSGTVPVVFVADSEAMMLRAVALAREFGIRPVISGAGQGYRLGEEANGVPLLVSVKWPSLPADAEEREEQPLRVIRDVQLAPTTPAALARRGATFALVSGPGKAGDFLPGIRTAIRNGLSTEDALRAVTLTPAQIFGAAKQLGSLERGRIANVVVTDGPIFDEGSKVVRLFVDGREIRLPKELTPDKESPPAPIAGSWSLTVRAADGNVALQVTLRAEGEKLTGNWSGDRGSGEIRGGSVTGSSFQFTISAPAQPQAEMSDWLFSGTFDGDAMSGTVTTTLGKFDFSGSRSR